MLSAPLERIRVSIYGTLQGVGFRPFVYRLAQKFLLNGWVQNSRQGVCIEAEGDPENLKGFIQCLKHEMPAHASIETVQSSPIDPLGENQFLIKESDDSEGACTSILPDVAVCSDCLTEVFEPSNRRYLYPFTHCTCCGPRFTLVESLPFDRQRTSMKSFIMCLACQKEYDDPDDRRFHSQTNACGDCGPQVEFWDRDGMLLSEGHEAMVQTVQKMREGAIVAIKGIGGFHLMVSANNQQALARLRDRKHREEKPFALMYPSLQSIQNDCELSSFEESLLSSPSAPIVLLVRKKHISIADNAAPDSPDLGVMLPYSPLHHILMRDLGFPVVATSGNISDETICTGNEEALQRLHGVADCFLVHNRPIILAVDDSITREVMGNEQVLRRSRGYAPLPVRINGNQRRVLAVGGHLKNTIAVAQEDRVYLSQHLGDLDSESQIETFQNTLDLFSISYAPHPERLLCDFHPDYLSTRWAENEDQDCLHVQHHVAHILSCMTENAVKVPALGIAWDGSGYGLDGTLWGGEFFRITEDTFYRVACFRPFPLPGGEQAIREPRRSALGLAYELLGRRLLETHEMLKNFSTEESRVLLSMMDNKINCPKTSSCGRLFDAVASLAGIRQRCSFEGQSAMKLESLARGSYTGESYGFDVVANPCVSTAPVKEEVPDCYDLALRYHVDVSHMVDELIHDVRKKVNCELIALKFHNMLVEIIIDLAKLIGEEKVVMSGGCFQNKYLTVQTIRKLKKEGFLPYWHQKVPPNDGGLALGQIAALKWQNVERSLVHVSGRSR